MKLLPRPIMRVLRRFLVFVLAIVVALLLADRAVLQIGKWLYPTDYGEYIEKYCTEYGVEKAFGYAMVKCESNFDANAESSAGAVGLMQLTPDTFDWLCERLNGEKSDRALLYDPETNIRCGIYYISYLQTLFETETEVIAAYNAGPARVKEWLGDDSYSYDGATLYTTPYNETENHIKKVINAKLRYIKLYNF